MGVGGRGDGREGLRPSTASARRLSPNTHGPGHGDGVRVRQRLVVTLVTVVTVATVVTGVTLVILVTVATLVTLVTVATAVTA